MYLQMELDEHDLETLALNTYARSGLDPARPVEGTDLAEILYGEDVWVRGGALLATGRACSGTLHGQVRIHVPRHLPRERRNFLTLHEVAHQLLGAPCRNGGELEAAANRLAAALMAPLVATRRLHAVHGFNLRSIALAMRSTQTCAALRLAEALELPLVSWGAIRRLRGPANWQWPPHDELERWRRRAPRGLARLPVGDERGRVVLVAA